MKHMETAPGGQDAPGGARYDPLKAGSVACRPSACPSTGRRRGGEASAAIDARGQPRGQPGDLCSTTGNLTTPPVVHDTRSFARAASSARMTMSKRVTAMSAMEAYVATHGVNELFSDALTAVLQKQPRDPAAFLASHFWQQRRVGFVPMTTSR